MYLQEGIFMSHATELVPRSVYGNVGSTSTGSFKELPSEMWELPAQIADASLRDLHSHLLAGMRRDVEHMPTGTLQAMQLERICYYYILIRYHESTGTWRDSADKRALYKLWRDLSSDFNATVYGGKISSDDLNNIVQANTARVVAAVLSSLPSEQARPLYGAFAAALDSSESKTSREAS
jgi:hypothetical protein